MDKRRITFRFGEDGFFDKSPGEIVVHADTEVVNSDDPSCPAEQFGQMRLEARKLDSGGKAFKLVIEENEEASEPIACLRQNDDDEDTELTGPRTSCRSVKIGQRRQVPSA